MPERDERDAKPETQPAQKPISDDDKPGWGPLPAKKKQWETPKVIVSSTRQSGGKGSPALEVSPAVTTTTGTGVS